MTRIALTDYERMFCTQGAQAGMLAIRGLTDANLIATAVCGTPEHALMCRLIGPTTNPYWVTDAAAEEAYGRGLIDEDELAGILA